MEIRNLSHTDLAVSRACFGTMTFGSQANQEESTRMVDFCMDRGVNFFDTANAYNGGRAEEVLGTALEGRRSRVVLASKVGMKAGEPEIPGGPAAPLSRRAVLAHIEGSLRRLKTDYLDLYYLHMPDYATPLEETLEAMDEVVRSGKARHLGISNYAAWQVERVLWISEKKGYKAPMVSQPMYNLLARGIEQEYIAFCKAFGVSMMVYNPLAGGLLSGKQHRERPIAGTRFDNNELYLNRYWHPAYFDAVDELRGVAERAGRSLVELALGWLLHHTAADGVILGASNIGQLRQNLDAFERGPLSPETAAECDAVWGNLRGVTPNYNR
jgi:1-deoxyxylulose-5-phosphate synthase